MIEIKEKHKKRLEIEKVEKSGWSGKFDRKTNFPKKEEEWKDFGEVDFEDNRLEEQEKKDNKLNRELERNERF